MQRVDNGRHSDALGDNISALYCTKEL